MRRRQAPRGVEQLGPRPPVVLRRLVVLRPLVVLRRLVVLADLAPAKRADHGRRFARSGLPIVVLEARRSKDATQFGNFFSLANVA